MKLPRYTILFWHKHLFALVIVATIFGIALSIIVTRTFNATKHRIEEEGRCILTRHTEVFLLKIAEGQADSLNSQLKLARSAAEYGALYLAENRPWHRDAVETFITRLQDSAGPFCTTAYVIKPDGSLITYAVSDASTPVSPEPFLSALPGAAPYLQRNEFTWSEAHTNPFSRRYEYVIDAIAPIRVGGIIKGHVCISVSLHHLIAQFNQRQPIAGSYSFLIDSMRRLVAAPPHARVNLSHPDVFKSRGAIDLGQTKNPELNKVLQNMVLGQSAVKHVNIKNDIKYIAYKPLDQIEWSLGIAVPAAMATANSAKLADVIENSTGNALTAVLLWTGGLMIAGLLVSGFLTRRVSRPLLEMAATAKQIADGDRATGILPSGRRDEVGILADAFNNMIKKRKLVEEALRRSEGNYRLLVDNQTDMIVKFDPKGRFLFASPSFCKTFGKNPDDLIGKTFHSFIHDEDRDKLSGLLSEISKPPYSGYVEGRAETVDGLRWQGWLSTALLNEQNETTSIIAVGRDITDRKQAEEILLENEAKYRRIVETANEGILASDADFVVNFANRVMADMLGYEPEEIIGLPMTDLVAKGDIKDYEERIKRRRMGIRERYERRLRRKDGTEIWTLISTTPVVDRNGRFKGSFAMYTDITARKRDEKEKIKLAQRLQQAEKMEAIGLLAGGVAHDFNNMLGIILGNTDLTLLDVSEQNPIRENLEEIRTVCFRARDIVNELLSFSRQTGQAPCPLKLPPVIRESMKLLRSSIPSDIDIQCSFPDTIRSVNADSTQINQIIINLCTNAAHSMEESGGTLTIEVEDTEIAPSVAGSIQNLSPLPYVRILVSDTGVGIPPELRHRIFDPYFTTKVIGKGSGMGLAVVNRIVKKLNGLIHVSSRPNRGTSIEILFPAVDDEKIYEDESPRIISTGEERILLVDDEKPLLEVGGKILKKMGYQVQTEANPMRALDRITAAPEDFDLVITDMTMPAMNGIRLTRKLHKVRPNLPIILCTGYSDRITPEKAKTMGIREYLQKPFDMVRLAEVVRRTLDGV